MRSQSNRSGFETGVRDAEGVRLEKSQSNRSGFETRNREGTPCIEYRSQSNRSGFETPVFFSLMDPLIGLNPTVVVLKLRKRFKNF